MKTEQEIRDRILDLNVGYKDYEGQLKLLQWVLEE